MKEKELRIALVCYGGVSLAVYMHGVAKEIWKLVRASRSYHAEPDVRVRADAPMATELHDSEAVYADLLRQIGGSLQLRVVVDVIAGASAGGINGVLLARALAHDLSLEPLTELWLEQADVEHLLAPDARARSWSKWFLRPMLWFAGPRLLRRLAPEAEVRDKLSLFVRSRWFRPPFDGGFLLNALHEALDAMGRSDRGGSLLPAGQPLDLYVTVTDFHGYAQRIPLHDPPAVVEREHRHVFAFHYRRRPNGEVTSDFSDDHVPGLAFAARATAAFPGAFPPTLLRELERYLTGRKRRWPGRDAFIRRNFAGYLETGADPQQAFPIDGSVLNNKPFSEAIGAIADRPAFREVDRRVVFVEPDPEETATAPRRPGAVPGFFRTLLAALAHIPRQEPVRDELAEIAEANRRLRRLKDVVETVRPEVARLVEGLIADIPRGGFDAGRLDALRDAANSLAVREAGFTYRGYLGLKLGGVETWLADLLNGICAHPADCPAAEEVAGSIAHWRDTVCDDRERPTSRAPPSWARFLLSFDVSFRVRRLRFVIRALNDLYGRVGEPGLGGVTAERLDALKGRLYDAFGLFRAYERGAFVDAALRRRARSLFGAGGQPASVARGPEEVADLLQSVAGEIDLRAANRVVDAALADFAAESGAAPAAHELLVAYLGFAFWDVLTYGLTGARDLSEFDEIRVDRISPEDARALRPGGVKTVLKGLGFGHFAAFFSRAYRENDYLWGRLHAAERLIAIVADAARAADPTIAIDRPLLCRHAFRAILAAERRRLRAVPQLLDDLEALLGG